MKPLYEKPKINLFDYGYTLFYEPGFDFLRGEEAFFEYVYNFIQEDVIMLQNSTFSTATRDFSTATRAAI